MGGFGASFLDSYMKAFQTGMERKRMETEQQQFKDRLQWEQAKQAQEFGLQEREFQQRQTEAEALRKREDLARQLQFFNMGGKFLTQPTEDRFATPQMPQQQMMGELPNPLDFAVGGETKMPISEPQKIDLGPVPQPPQVTPNVGGLSVAQKRDIQLRGGIPGGRQLYTDVSSIMGPGAVLPSREPVLVTPEMQAAMPAEVRPFFTPGTPLDAELVGKIAPSLVKPPSESDKPLTQAEIDNFNQANLNDYKLRNPKASELPNEYKLQSGSKRFDADKITESFNRHVKSLDTLNENQQKENDFKLRQAGLNEQRRINDDLKKQGIGQQIASKIETQYKPVYEAGAQFNSMADSYDKVLKAAEAGTTDQQAMVNILANHIAMTTGKAGMRPTQALFQETM